MSSNKPEIPSAAPPEPHRKCHRLGCDNPAIKPKGKEWHARLCRDCAAERRRRSAASKAQPKCSCGACAPKGATLCRRCDERVTRSRAEEAEAVRLQRILMDRYGHVRPYDGQGLFGWAAAAIESLEGE